MRFAFVLALLLVSAACQRQPQPRLGDVVGRLEKIPGHVPLGDIQGVTFGPFPHAEWLVLIPPMATAATIEAAQPLVRWQPEALGRVALSHEPLMALVKEGRIVESIALPEPWTVDKVLVKDAAYASGLRFARYAGMSRSYKILRID